MTENSDIIRLTKETAIERLLQESSIAVVESELKKLAHLNCSLSDKFDLISAQDILNYNKKDRGLDVVIDGIYPLIHFGRNLLLNENVRPTNWHHISSSGRKRERKWKKVYGHEEIMQLYGYIQVDSGWEFPDGVSVMQQQVAITVIELILLKLELSMATSSESARSKEENECKIESKHLSGEMQKNKIDKVAEVLGSIDWLMNPNLNANKKGTESSKIVCNESTVCPPNALNSNEGLSVNKVNISGEENSTQNINVMEEICQQHSNIFGENKKPDSGFGPKSFVKNFMQGVWKMISLPNSSEMADRSNQKENITQEKMIFLSNSSKMTDHPNQKENIQDELIVTNKKEQNNNSEVETGPDMSPIADEDNNTNLQENDSNSKEQTSSKEDTSLTLPTCVVITQNDVKVVSKSEENLQRSTDILPDSVMVLKRSTVQVETRTVRDGQHCDLCGSSEPVVRCEKCSNQIFCLSCDEMYHRHPKRRNHARKAVESFKSPLVKAPDKEADPNRLPVPPPRRRKSQKSVPSSPLFGRKFSHPNPPLPKKEFSFMEKVGSLRRMIGRPLPPVPKDEPPERPPKTFPQTDSPFRRMSSSCSSYSNVSDNEVPANDIAYVNYRGNSPAYANEQVAQPDQNWEQLNNGRTSQSAYPNALDKGDTGSAVQLNFQGFPTLPKRMYNNPYENKSATMIGTRTGPAASSSVCDLPNRPVGMSPMGMPQTQSIQDMSNVQPMSPYMNPYMNPYPMNPYPWIPQHPNFYHPNFIPPDMKRTPSNSSMNYPCSESGFRLNSYTSMGHLHNPMAMSPYPIYPPQTQRPQSPTHSSKSSRLHKTHSISGEGPFPKTGSGHHSRSGRRATHAGIYPGRGSLHDYSSSEEDYFSVSDEDDMRSSRSGRRSEKGWQCEHCTLINPPNTRICTACCKTGGNVRRSSGDRRRRRRDGGVRSPSSGDSRPPSGQKGRKESKTSEEMVDAMAQELVNEMDQISMKNAVENKVPSAMQTEVIGEGMNNVEIKKGSLETENGVKTEENEPQRKKQVISTGTSPPPQTISTQTNVSDGSASEEPRSPALYRPSSRSSLIGIDREFSYRRPSIHGNANADQIPYYSSSRSLFGGISRDPSPVRSYRGDTEFGSHRERQYSVEPISRNDYYLNLEELIERRRQEKMRSQGFELVRLLREAEHNDFTADDLQVAMSHCGNQNAIQWLQENWKNMIDTVVTLVTNYGRDKQENDVGVISSTEAKESLRRHKGNVWAAVTDCVEIRQRKFKELQMRGDFNRNEVIASLTANHGNVDSAFLELAKNATKPFHMKIWGPPVGVDNESGITATTAVQRQNSGKINLSKPLITPLQKQKKIFPIDLPPEAAKPASLVDTSKKNWIESLTGGSAGVGVVTESKISENEGRLEFQPNHSTPHKVNRMGSFSGGSYTSLASFNNVASEITKKKPIEDNYVTVQWVKEIRNPEQEKHATPQPKIEEMTIYSSLQELGLDTSISKTTPTIQEIPGIKTLPKFPIVLDQFKDIDDDEDEEIDRNKKMELTDSVYTTFEEIKATETASNNKPDTSEEAIDAATQSIFQTVRTLIYDAVPPDTNQVVPTPTTPPLPEPASPEVLSVAITLPRPAPPVRTEASKKASSEFERRARMYLAEGKVTTYNQAEIVVKLLDLQFPEEDAVAASLECSEIDMAISFLQQDCELCAGKFPMRQMISMLHCVHRCCQSCARDYFTIQFRDRNILEAICPFCDQPDLTDDEIAGEYFNNLDIMLKNLVDEEIHELFQRKLRDRALMKDPNFHWCSQCSSGFIAPPMAIKLNCPDCQAVTCAKCRKPWESQHNGITCEQFMAWKEANDPEFQAKGLEKHLELNGIDCPSCRFRYSLAKGGCMHFQCLQCKYDFCSGCGKPFRFGPKCNFSPMCMKLGLHAHHPRNCLFYLRDKDPADLQKLLTKHNVNFNTEPPPLSAAAQTDPAIFKCQVMEQKEIPGEGLKDDFCGRDVAEGHAGLCSSHYIEYLVNLICKNGVDPVDIFDQTDLQQELRRRGQIVPEQMKIQTDDQYREILIQIIQEQIPLDETNR